MTTLSSSWRTFIGHETKRKIRAADAARLAGIALRPKVRNRGLSLTSATRAAYLAEKDQILAQPRFDCAVCYGNDATK